MLVTEWIDRAKDKRGDQGTEEGSPERFQWEVVRHFLQTEQNATDRGAECHRHTRGSRSRQDFPLFRFVATVLGEEVGQNVPDTARDVHHRALLAQAQARRHGQHDADGFDDERPLAQIAADDKARQDRLDLRYTGSASVRRKHAHQRGGQQRKQHRPHYVEEVRDDVRPEPFPRGSEDLRPGVPLRAVAAVEGRLVRGPAALFAVQPEGLRTDAELQIRHPTRTDIDHTGHAARKQAHQQHAHPARPRIMGTLKAKDE